MQHTEHFTKQRYHCSVIWMYGILQTVKVFASGNIRSEFCFVTKLERVTRKSTTF